MSYILDALRRADAERERGHLPGLHSHEATPAPRAERASALRAGLIGLGAGTALALGALWVWRHGAASASNAPVVASAVATAAGPPPVTPTVDPSPAATPVPPAPAIVAPATPVPTVSPPSPVAVAALAAKPRQATPPRVGNGGAALDDTGAPSPVASANGTSADVSGTAPADSASGPIASARLYRLDELPEDVRRQLPTLNVGGSAYSGHSASRFVIVNGQLFHEGDTLGPGLTLEQIRLRSAVLAFKGYRYGINF